MRAAKKHGSPLGYSVFQKVLNGRGLDGAFETPQALTLSDIRSPGNPGQVQIFVEMFMDKAYHFLDTHIIRIRNWFPGIHCMGIVHVKGTADTGQFFADHELVSQWFAGKCIKGRGEDGSGISLSGVFGKRVKRTAVKNPALKKRRHIPLEKYGILPAGYQKRVKYQGMEFAKGLCGGKMQYIGIDHSAFSMF